MTSALSKSNNLHLYNALCYKTLAARNPTPLRKLLYK